MRQWGRIGAVVATVLALAIVPIVADWCAASCDAAHAAAAAGPSCHHTAPATPRVGPIPAPCGHDHHPVVVDAATTGAAAMRMLPSTAPAIADVALIRPDAVTFAAARRSLPPNSPPLSLALASTLRV